MHKIKKVLFIIRSTEHFTYYESIIKALCDKNIKTKILFNKNWGRNIPTQIKNFQKENKNFEFGWSKIRKNWIRMYIFPLRELLSYRRYLLIKNQSDYYKKRWRSYLIPPLPFLTKYEFVNSMIKSNLFGHILSQIEFYTPADKNILIDIKNFKPAIVIAGPANMRFSEEIEYIKAAKKINIPTVIPVLSWDNLTTKGLIHITPDLLLVWNKSQEKEAIIHQKINKKNIKIAGSPFFDKWFGNLKPSINRTVFCTKLGLNPNDPILLYLGSSGNIASDETWLIQEIRQSLDQAKDNRLNRTQLIIRPHPANAKIYQKISKPKLIIYPKGGSLPSTNEKLQIFYDTLYYASAVVGINTSAMIDAVIINKPIIAMMSEKYRQTQQEAQHFQHLLKNNVMELAYSKNQFLKKFLDVLNGKDNLKKKRENFVSLYINPLGFKNTAGEVMANQIEKMLV